jgi:hypothetical protein
MPRALLIRLGAIAFGLLLVVALLELVLRSVAPGAISLVVKDEILGRRYRPGFEQRRYIPESDREIHLRFNRYGFRGPDHAEGKPAATRRIALHGDSQVAAVPVAESETMAARLAGLLAPGWEVLNFGVSAYGTGQSYLAWRYVSRRFEPDLVVLVFLVSNDVGDNVAAPSLDAPAAPAGTFGVRRWLTEHTLVYPWHKHVLRRARVSLRRRARVISPDLHSLNTRPPESIERGWRNTFEILERFHREVVEAGSDFLLVISPDPGQFDDRVWREMLELVPAEEAPFFDPDYPQRRLLAFAEERGIPTLDLLAGFRKRRADGPLSFGRGHWNVEGNRLAARLVHEHLEGGDPGPALAGE